MGEGGHGSPEGADRLTGAASVARKRAARGFIGMGVGEHSSKRGNAYT